jgi:hypothetical protein
MTEDQIQIAFLDWWRQSYPTAPPNSRTIQTHAAFAAYILQMNTTLHEYTNERPV